MSGEVPRGVREAGAGPKYDPVFADRVPVTPVRPRTGLPHAAPAVPSAGAPHHDLGRGPGRHQVLTARTIAATS
ncbi:hypothetical protein [Streptomyces sp. NPDC059787]|uniref:hypothetical protein n=1 Tax=Streptomyces sp. NPDC059787 TaxID=3346947 RepID=UPI0036626371